MYYFYFLELSNSDLYVGFSSNLMQRFKAHNEGKVPATESFLPEKLKSYAAVEKNHGLRKIFQNWIRKSSGTKRVFINFSRPTYGYLACQTKP